MGYRPDCLGMVGQFAGIDSIAGRINVEWQHNKEHTALSRTTLDVKLSAMSLHNFPRDRESQPHA